MLTSEAFLPTHFVQELCWKAKLIRTSGVALHFEILIVATLLLLTVCNTCQAAELPPLIL